MLRFRYDTSGKWFKGNTHLHTKASDGGKTSSEAAELYATANYDFLCRADHWVASDVAKEGEAAPVLWIDGIELNGPDHSGAQYHIVCLGRFEGLSAGDGLIGTLEKVRAQGGLTILAHPHWMHNSIDDALRHGFEGVEVYNHVCHWLNGKGDGVFHWDAMLTESVNTLGFAVDDAHLRDEHPGWNGGWIVVNAPACDTEMILAAVRAGNFYSSRGPEFHRIELFGNQLTLHTSPVRFVRLIGPGWMGQRLGSFDGDMRTETVFDLPKDWQYYRVEIEDECGKVAWTNSLFRQE